MKKILLIFITISYLFALFDNITCNSIPNFNNDNEYTFDARDIFRNSDDRTISTKIVNKKFDLTIMALDKNSGSLKNFTGIVCIKVVNSDWIRLEFDDQSEYNTTDNDEDLIPIQTFKDTKVDIKWYRIGNYGMIYSNQVNSSDNFAVRPDRFFIDTNQSVIRAGNDFDISFQALDYNNNLSKDYNESEGDSFEVKYIDIRNCKLEKFNPDIKGFDFNDGEKNITTKYPEVGEINITIQEKDACDDKFASVDCNDKDVDGYWNKEKDLPIPSYSKILTFIPDHFEVNSSLQDFNSSFTYLSSDLNMSANAKITITAKNKDNNTTKNYNKECYSKPIDINISFLDINNSSLNKLSYIIQNVEDKNLSKQSLKLNSLLQINLNENNFTTDINGSTHFSIYFNFDKNYSNPSAPFEFNITDINVSDTNSTFSKIKNLKGKTTFYYGRIKTFNKAGFGDNLQSKFIYQYYDKNAGWITNTKHTDKIFGEVKGYKALFTKLSLDNIKNGVEDVNFSTNHSLPLSDSIELNISSWLWYNPISKEYKPISDNIDCLSHPCFRVEFLRNAKSWAGIEKNNYKYSEENRTIEINSTSGELNITKSQVKRINW